MARVLVVEDDKNQRTLYRMDLDEEGYEVETAASAAEAIEKIEADPPALVGLDIEMPGMDGVEALGKILGRDRSIPVILNTAYTSYKDNFMTWSAEAYVVKSSDLTELKTQIKKALAARGKDG